MARVQKVAALTIPITPALIFDLLRNKVVKASWTLPAYNSDGIINLARSLEFYRQYVRARPDALIDDDLRDRTVAAVTFLDGALPKIRGEYESNVAATERWEMVEAHASAQADLAAIVDLEMAIARMRERRLPHSNMLATMGGAAESWKDIAPMLIKLFFSSLGEQTKAASYRFVEVIMPYMTGEQPTYETIETEFKKKPFVNGGNAIH
jgi:hypothetical protein